MLEVMKTQIVGHDKMALGDRKQMIDQCEARKSPADERRCYFSATDVSAIAACTKLHHGSN